MGEIITIRYVSEVEAEQDWAFAARRLRLRFNALSPTEELTLKHGRCGARMPRIPSARIWIWFDDTLPRDERNKEIAAQVEKAAALRASQALAASLTQVRPSVRQPLLAVCRPSPVVLFK